MNLLAARQHYRRATQAEPTFPDDAHALVALVMTELHGALDRLGIAQANGAALPTDAMVRAMSAIYVLQSSLDMDADPAIAVPLFQVYEFCRQQVMAAFRKEEGQVDGLVRARDFIATLKAAWDQMDRESAVPA